MYKVLLRLAIWGIPETSLKTSIAAKMLCSMITSLLFAQSLTSNRVFSAAFSASAFEPLQSVLHDAEHDIIDIITGSDFHGLTTFANLPYSNCFKERGESVDIAILGAPFDTVSTLLFLPFASRSVGFLNPWIL